MVELESEELRATAKHPLGRYKILALLKEHRVELANRFGIERVALFGSTVRGEAGSDSDIDILVHFRGRADFHRYLRAKDYIEDLLGRTVDLVDERALREELRPYIEEEARYV